MPVWNSRLILAKCKYFIKSWEQKIYKHWLDIAVSPSIIGACIYRPICKVIHQTLPLWNITNSFVCQQWPFWGVPFAVILQNLCLIESYLLLCVSTAASVLSFSKGLNETGRHWIWCTPAPTPFTIFVLFCMFLLRSVGLSPRFIFERHCFTYAPFLYLCVRWCEIALRFL